MISSLPTLPEPFRQFGKVLTAENAVIVIYGFLGFIGILHHEMWRDEMQAWLMARDSQSLTALFSHMQHEGHPALWHLCLYVLSQFTHNPFVVQLFHLAIAIGIVVLVVKYSPFNSFNRFIFPFGYFTFYEYCLISRNYNLGVFLLFLFCFFYCRNKENYVLFGVILALLANVNVFMLICSFSAFLAVFIHTLRDRQIALQTSRQWRNLWMGGAIALAGWAISVIQVGRLASRARVIREVSVATPGAVPDTSFVQILEEGKRFINALAGVWQSYVPIAHPMRDHFWNTNILLNSRLGNTIHVADLNLAEFLAFTFSLATIAISLWLLSDHLLSVLMYGCGISGLTLFNYLALKDAGLRHYGHLFILLIAALWLNQANSWTAKPRSQPDSQSFRARSRPSRRMQWRHAWLSLFLGLQLIGGLYAYRMDLARPFSVMQLAANYLRSHNLQHHFILGHRYRQAAGLAGYLDRQIFYPETQKWGSFWTIREPEIKQEEELLQIIQEVRQQYPADMVLVLTRPIAPPPELKIVELARFEGGIEVSERQVYIYMAETLETNIQRSPLSTSAPAPEFPAMIAPV